MLDLFWILPFPPLAGFVVLAQVALAGRVRRRWTAAIGVGTIALSALVAVGVAVRFLTSPPAGSTVSASLGGWIAAGNASSRFDLLLDPLSLVMVLVVTVVGFFIHLYAAELMLGEDRSGYARFFAVMNLFVAAMLVLVLADDLALLLLGWEGVGLCSYLLIGFWYQEESNGRAARKAFVITRIGDVSLLLGIFQLFHHLGTLSLGEALQRAADTWSRGDPQAVLIAALLLGGAVGKSAQLPLQTWLPDAMAGPTPVSALIHAATMVTAGVYLIARTNAIFLLAPPVLAAVAIIGAVTLLVGGLSALVQRDIKRVLAYSTMSQIGYMFLALGVGAFSAAIFHLMTHSFFKALLFLGAGSVILALDGEHDIGRMGGLRRRLPITTAVFVVAAASLAGFPLVTAGFYSKDTLLAATWGAQRGAFWLWAAGLLGAFVTSLYAFRLVFLVFFGEERTPVRAKPHYRIKVPFVALAVLSIVGGFVELPANLGDLPLFSQLLERTLPALDVEHTGLHSELVLQVVAGAASLAGILLAWLWFRPRSPGDESEQTRVPMVPAALGRLWLGGWGFDRLYDALVVTPFIRLARRGRNDVVDAPFRGLAAVVAGAHRLVLRSQTGRVRWYAAGLALGAAAVLALLLVP